MEKATEYIKAAIVADQAGMFDLARKNYENGISEMNKAMSAMPTEYKHQVQQRIDAYRTRVDAIKKAIAAKPKSSSSTTTNNNQHENGNMEDRPIRPRSVQTVRWDDVIGLEATKQLLREAVILPRKFPGLFQGKRRPWRGILLFGPPGTGKSYLAKALATESESTFFPISSSDVVSKWQGESQKLVRQLFENARKHAPSVVFIDEVDSIGGERNGHDTAGIVQLKTEFLIQMDGVTRDESKPVMVLGATNTPWSLDPALRRRFEKRVYVPLPDEPARTKMFATGGLSQEDCSVLAKETEGYSGADIDVVIRTALMEPLREAQLATKFTKDEAGMYLPDQEKGEVECSLYDIEDNMLKLRDVSVGDYRSALKRSSCTVSRGDLCRFEEWTRDFGQDGN